jgi:ubiquinone/menaquinone biosynthesis C-methylase UbiE
VDAALAEVYRVVRPGGFVQFSIEHPFATVPVRSWIRDENGDKLALAVGEPRASDAAVASRPDMADTRIVPYFLHIRARRG